MKKLSSILLLSSLLFLPACGGSSDDQVENTNPPQPQPEVNNQTTPDNLPPNPLSTVSGLIPSTNPNERLKQIEQGKNNPFSGIRPPAVVKVNSTTPISSNSNIVRDKAIAKIDNSVNSSTSQNNRQVALLKTNKTNNGNKISSGNAGTNAIDMQKQLDMAPTIPEPEIPVPTEAQAFLVSGILDLQGENIALIKTPWDTIPRSVRVGDIISDPTGSITVRVQEISFKESSTNNVALIDNNQTLFRNIGAPNGVVVLEQYGQLVTKEVAQNASSEG
jgi:Tfp pilus assembly protein PilP